MKKCGYSIIILLNPHRSKTPPFLLGGFFKNCKFFLNFKNFTRMVVINVRINVVEGV